MLKYCVETMFENKGEELLQACISSKITIMAFCFLQLFLFQFISEINMATRFKGPTWPLYYKFVGAALELIDCVETGHWLCFQYYYGIMHECISLSW